MNRGWRWASLPQGRPSVGAGRSPWLVWPFNSSVARGSRQLSAGWPLELGWISEVELGVCVSWSDGPGRQWPGFWGARLQCGVSRAAGRERRRQRVLGPSGFVTQRVTCMWFRETVRVPRQPRGRARPPRFLWGEAGASAIVITTAWTTGAKEPWSPSPQVRVAPPGPLCSSPVCGVF